MGSDAKETYAVLSNSLCGGGRMTYEEAHGKILARDDVMVKQGMRQMAEAVVAMVQNNYGGSEAKSFRHAFWRELRKTAAQLGVSLDAKEGKKP